MFDSHDPNFLLSDAQAVPEPHQCGSRASKVALTSLAIARRRLSRVMKCRLHEQISDWNTYVNEFYARSEWFHPRDHGPRVEIDACHMTWSSLIRDVPTQPGPQLGYLTAERQHQHGYRITAYRACE